MPPLTSNPNNVLVPFMSAQPSPTPPPDDPGQHAADPHGYGEVLHDLITMGAGFARLLHGQATTQAHAAQHPAASAPQDTTAQPAPDALIPLATAFDRIARAVRRSILLARSLAQPVQPAPLQPAHDPARTRAAARRRILREVEDAIQRPSATADRPGAEALRAELRDRLEAPDLDDDITTRPVADIITELCRDLGLAALPGARPWKRRTPEDIRQLHARAAVPSAVPQPSAGPQAPRRDATPRSPDPSPDQRTLVPRTQPGPVYSAIGPPEDPARTIAMILRHPTNPAGRSSKVPSATGRRRGPTKGAPPHPPTLALPPHPPPTTRATPLHPAPDSATTRLRYAPTLPPP